MSIVYKKKNVIWRLAFARASERSQKWDYRRPRNICEFIIPTRESKITPTTYTKVNNAPKNKEWALTDWRLVNEIIHAITKIRPIIANENRIKIGALSFPERFENKTEIISKSGEIKNKIIFFIIKLYQVKTKNSYG